MISGVAIDQQNAGAKDEAKKYEYEDQLNGRWK